MLRFFFIRRPAWVMWLLIILTTVCVHLITMHFNALRFDEFRLEVMQELEFYKRQLQMVSFFKIFSIGFISLYFYSLIA